eukprot:2238885-Amphidinium_carterae.1
MSESQQQRAIFAVSPAHWRHFQLLGDVSQLTGVPTDAQMYPTYVVCHYVSSCDFLLQHEKEGADAVRMVAVMLWPSLAPLQP